ncbi:DUF3549 family protein [Vibrio sp. SM6]|uniref:DUF3549 family protein n=1 Tax=Vibrio agarilyticus TaxID=2726741 RepID=A0A7X8YHA2_9VIBR|nr:DUF3549 family protein [Vibrio agarilyticus]NLS13147.1 DUF3549 family protein [Vibrio agarilyticus]
MTSIHTLSELLQGSGCHYAIYDLGRRLNAISQTQFSNIEAGKSPYPYPLQRKAHLAIAYWNDTKQPWIWFLKFDLDERGLLQPGDIGQFLHYVFEAMGSRLSGDLSQADQQKLANNPFTYKPTEDKLAVFHSQLRTQLKMPTSAYYEHAQHYLSGQLGWENWQTVGLQGISDVCARLDSEQNSVLVRKALPHLPTEPRYALLGALEHGVINETLAKRVIELAEFEIDQASPDLFLIAAYLRALSGADAKLCLPLVSRILNAPELAHPEILIAIAGRSWHWLALDGMAEPFLIALANGQRPALFQQVFADLVMLPPLRLILLPLLHSSPSPQLAQALQNLQQSTRGQEA